MPPRGEGANHPAAPRPAGGHEIVEQAVDDGLIEDALLAVALEVEFQRLQLDTGSRRRVGEGDGAEVGLPRLGAEAGELRADDLNGVIAPGYWLGNVSSCSTEGTSAADTGAPSRGCVTERRHFTDRRALWGGAWEQPSAARPCPPPRQAAVRSSPILVK